MSENGPQPAPSRARRPTALDVARAAGLSQTTVSFVLNNSPHHKIPEATRKRVLEAAAQLGYTPSAAARALARGRSSVVLCLLRNIPMGPDLGRFLDEVSGHLEAADLTFVWHPRARSRRPLADVWRNVTPAVVITFEPLAAGEAEHLLACGALLIEGSAEGDPLYYGSAGIHLGGLQAEYLADRGYRQLGYAYPTDVRLQPVADGRLRGVRETAAERGLPEPMRGDVDYEREDGSVEAVRAWREAGVEAVCAYNDEYALAVQAGARALGHGPMPVIGVDDLPAARFGDPPLTTIRRDWSVVGDRAAAVIVAMLEGREPPPVSGAFGDYIVPRRSA
jgi:DNA-binding LacI/PurR family transcriptional regulator